MSREVAIERLTDQIECKPITGYTLKIIFNGNFNNTYHLKLSFYIIKTINYKSNYFNNTKLFKEKIKSSSHHKLQSHSLDISMLKDLI